MIIRGVKGFSNIILDGAYPMTYLIISAAFVFSISSGSFLIKSMPRLSVYVRSRNDQSSVQCSHIGDPPRTGGIAVLAGVAFGVALQILSGA